MAQTSNSNTILTTNSLAITKEDYINLSTAINATVSVAKDTLNSMINEYAQDQGIALF